MPETVKRTVRITTRQDVLSDVPPVEEGFPIRKWSIRVAILDSDGNEMPAACFDKVIYKLHPTFANPTRIVKRPPFMIEEQGWGEFDMKITLHFADRGGEQVLNHDLNFAQNHYVVDHPVIFPTNRPGLLALLAQSGPVPGNAGAGAGAGPSAAAAGGAMLAIPGDKRAAGADVDKSKVKKARVAEKGSVDLEKLAQGLEKLGEDDILAVVQMVTDNRTPEMYVRNDADAGEFRMDLYTLPDRLLKSMWDLVKSRVES